MDRSVYNIYKEWIDWIGLDQIDRIGLQGHPKIEKCFQHVVSVNDVPSIKTSVNFYSFLVAIWE